MLHAQTHPTLDVEGCYGCKIASVRFGGLYRFKAEREGNYTQAEIARDIQQSARESGKDIMQKRGRRRPHEVKRDIDSSWEQV